MKYTGHDRDITDVNSISLEFNAFSTLQELGEGGSVGRLPNENAPGAAISEVTFQFPPKIFTDNRSADWKGDKPLPGRNPVYSLALTNPREFSLEFKYVVTSFDDAGGAQSGNEWSIVRIKKIVNFLRGYYTLNRLNNANASDQIVYFYYPYYTGPEPWSCLLKSTNVKQSETIVGNNSTFFYPLLTTVTLDMRIWTTGALPPNNEIAQNIDGLNDEPLIGDLWF